MPLVRITLRKGKSPEALAAIGEAIHQALVVNAPIPPADRFHIIEEVEADHLIADPTYGGVNRSEGLIVIQITLNVGRTLEVKKKLYADIAARLAAAADVRPDDVLICLVEVAKENWSFGNGLATYA